MKPLSDLIPDIDDFLSGRHMAHKIYIPQVNLLQNKKAEKAENTSVDV